MGSIDIRTWCVIATAVLAAIGVVQRLVDAWSTWRCLRLGGGEKTAIVRRQMERLGVGPALVLTKGGAALALVAVAVATWRLVLTQYIAVSPVALVLLVWRYQAVLRNNLRVMADLVGRAGQGSPRGD